MTKKEIEKCLLGLPDDYEVDLNELARDADEAHMQFIEELEERQSASGFYAFQDTMDRRRMEW